jgi:hypothetical protein
MKEFNLADLFGELLSGILVLIVSILILDYCGFFTLKDIIKCFKIELGFITFILLFCYFLGIIMHSIGLTLGELFLDNLITTKKEPTEKQKKKYFKNVQEHVSAYRDRQWKYYSLYRNIFIIIIIGLFFYCNIVWREIGSKFTVITTFIIVLVLISLYFTMRTLINLYYRITKSYD